VYFIPIIAHEYILLLLLLLLGVVDSYLTGGTTIASGVSYLGGSRLKLSTNTKTNTKKDTNIEK